MAPVGVGSWSNEVHLLGYNCAGHEAFEVLHHASSWHLLTFNRHFDDQLRLVPLDVVQVLLIAAVTVKAVVGGAHAADACCFDVGEEC